MVLRLTTLMRKTEVLLLCVVQKINFEFNLTVTLWTHKVLFLDMLAQTQTKLLQCYQKLMPPL